MKIIIPLQTCSTRIPLKNIRPFYRDDSLFDIKAKQILEFESAHNVYVSSEDELKVKPLCEKYGFNFMLRDAALTGNKIYQPDLVKALTDPLPGDDDIMWIQVTSPLFNQFKEALTKWQEVRHNYDSLAAVKPFKGHLLDEKGNPSNYNFGYWHKVSQDLPKLYTVLWSLFILKRETVNRFNYHIGVNPYLFITDTMVVDIDYHEDFELARMIYDKIYGVVN